MKIGLSATMLAATMMMVSVDTSAALVIKENMQYRVVKDMRPVPTSKTEVVEFFSFACPHCAHLEPILQKWKKTIPSSVTFRRIPVVFRPQWESLAKVYFTLEALKLPQLEPEVFKAIHEKNQDLSRSDVFMAWLGSQKVDTKKAQMMYDSFTVNTQVAQAKTIAQQYRIEGVPTLLVGGRYITDVGMAGGAEQLPEVLNQLITLVQKNHSQK